MSPARLALLRLMVGVYTLYYLAVRQSMYGKIFRTDVSLFEPVGVVAWLNGLLPPHVCDLVLCLTLLVNIAFVLGLGFRITGPVFAGLLLAVLTYRNSWSTILHSDPLLVLHVFVLGFARSADALSVDSLARRWRASRRQSTAPQVGTNFSGSDWRYGWPIQLMCAITVLVYFLAGIAKVCGPLGWSWAMGDALRSQTAVDALRKEVLGSGAQSILFVLFSHVWLFTVLGIVTLVVELGAPAAMFNKRFAQVWTVVAFMFHWGIFFTMGITFRYQLSAIAFSSFFVRDFLPKQLRWPHLLSRIRALFVRRRISPRGSESLGRLSTE